MLEKLKSLVENDQVFYSLLIILVAIVSFWLGRLSVDLPEPETSRVQVIYPQNSPQTSPKAATYNSERELTSNTNQPSVGVVVGSRSGDKYHLPTCPGAKQIKPENLVSFSSVAAAVAAGYKPAANCPQLQ